MKASYVGGMCLTFLFGPTAVLADDNKQASVVTLKLRGSCDQPSFNTQLGPGGCVGSFRTTFGRCVTT